MAARRGTRRNPPPSSPPPYQNPPPTMAAPPPPPAAAAPGPTPAAQVVGNAFVTQYYNILHQSPELVFRFYQEASYIGRPASAGADLDTVTTMEAINEKITSMDIARAEIKGVDAQDSLCGGVAVLVTGHLTGKDDVCREFVQSFFLAPQEKGYFVLNDILRYVGQGEATAPSLPLAAPQQPAPEFDAAVAPAAALANGIVDGPAESVPRELDAQPQPEPDLSEPAPHDEEDPKEEVYNPPNEVEVPVVEEIPVAEVIDEVPNNVPASVPVSAPPVPQEEVPKKSYASIATGVAIASCPIPSRPSMIQTCLNELCASLCSCLLPSSPRSEPHPHMAGAAVITHRTVEVSTGVRLHVAEAGPAGAPAVLLLHGFPELWYTWRHQMRALAASGYRAVAPDMRGYGGSDAPPDADQYTALHVVGDLVALIDALGEKQVFVVAHDWGAVIAWSLCLFRPDRVKALVALSVAFNPRSPARRPVDGLKALFGDEYYICRIQEPGAIEAEFARLGTEQVLRKFFAYRTPGPLFIPESGWGSPDDEVPLPSWITEEDIKYYTKEFDKSGFTGGLNYYRALNKTWELTSPWTGAQIKVPTKFIVGDLDLTYHTAGIQDFIHKGGLKKFVPLLDDVVVMKDVGHFINEEKPEEVSAYILNFIQKFK